MFSIFKPLLNFIIWLCSFLGRSVNLWLLSIFRNTPGYLGLSLRYIFLKNSGAIIGKNVAIHPNVFIKHPEKLSLGENVSIHPFTYIEAGGEIIIGNNVSVAHSSSLLSYNHSWEDKDQPIKYNKLIPGKIVIKDDVWVGCGVRILPDTVIGYRVVIAAGAVVNKSISDNKLVGGVPAKTIKDI